MATINNFIAGAMRTRNLQDIELGQKPCARPLGLPPIQGCQSIIIDGQQYDIPFGMGPEGFENFLADREDPPSLAGNYKWHCAKQILNNNDEIVVCGTENYAPRILLDGDDCGNGSYLSCQKCGHDSIEIKKCEYPDCWWRLFNVLGHQQKDFCIYHTTHDPEHIMDVITTSVICQDQYGDSQTYGGQAFLDQCNELDDYDAELDWFTGLETELNLMKTI